jgi:hypothetical protein
VAFAHGLRSETQLADLLGCEFAWNPLNRAWLPQRDSAGRSSVAEVYLAGDGAGIMGADAAEMAGERAALALLEDIGYLIPAQRCVCNWNRPWNASAIFARAWNAPLPFPSTGPPVSPMT